jgi:hypothetical protein
MKTKIVILFLLISSFCFGQKIEPVLINSGETWGTARGKINANTVRLNDSAYNVYLKTKSLEQSVNTIAAVIGSGGGGSVIPTSNNFMGFDSTHTLTVAMKFAIPENVSNGEYVGLWKKTVTWRSNNNVVYSIEKNHLDAFILDENTGVISIGDATKINGRVITQDTLIRLLIRSNDVVLGYEIDTAYIRVKENAFCKFIDFSAASAGSGTKASPYNDFGQATLQAGYAYFVKRGNSTVNKYYNVPNVVATSAHPTIIGAYGSGSKPKFSGSGLTASVDGLITFPNPGWQYAELYDWDVRDYPEHAFRVNSESRYFGIYNMYFSNNVRVSIDGDLADVYFFGNPLDTAYADRNFMEMWHCESYLTQAPIVKCDAAGLTMINIKAQTSDTRWAKGYNGRVGCAYATIKHFYFIGGGRSLQMRFAHSSAIDGIIEGATEAAWFGVEWTSGVAPRQDVLFDNILVRNCLDGFYIYNSSLDNHTFRRVYFHNNSGRAMFFNNGGDKNIIENCTFIGNGTGIELNNGSRGLSNSTIQYNVFSGNLSGAIIGTDASAATNLKLYNNTIDGSAVLSGTTSTTARNNFYKSTMSGVTTSSNNINIDAITVTDYFSNYSEDDFRLRSTAANAIDAGYSVGAALDMINTSILNGVADIGAFEYNPITTSESSEVNIATLRSDISTEIGDTARNVKNSLLSILATKQGSLSLTTTGSSGAATLSGSTLNIPQYAGGGSMTWPTAAGISNYSGSSSWGTSYTTSGSGTVIPLATSPTFITPDLGAATATTINKVVITAPSTLATLTIANGKLATINNTITLSGTDGSTLNIGTGGTLGTGAYATISDYAPLTSPSLTTPSLGVATASSINKLTITTPATSATLTVANGKTFTANNTLTLSGSDGSTLNVGTGGTLGTGAYATISNYATKTNINDSIASLRVKINLLRHQMDSILGTFPSNPPDNWVYVTDPGDNNDIAANIATAYASASDGDVLILPEGIFKYSGGLALYKLVSIYGAGKNKTILYRDNAVSDASTAEFFFEYGIYEDYPTNIVFKGMTLRSKTPADLNNQNGSLLLDYGLTITQAVDFVVTDVRFENFGVGALSINHKSTLARGVIYNCEFYHNFKGDHLGYGFGVGVYGNDASWVTGPGFGTDNFIFIEDNSFDYHFQAINTNNSGLAVVRHNTISNNWIDAAVNVHESYGTPTYPGRAIEVYNNIINATKFANGASAGTDIVAGHAASELFVVAISPKGGDALVFDNQISGYQYAIHATAFPDAFDDVAYPVHYGLGYLSGVQYGEADRSIDHNNGDGFFWNNIMQTYLGYTPSLFTNWSPTWFVESRDYHFTAKPGYTPYTYPHPLRSN